MSAPIDRARDSATRVVTPEVPKTRAAEPPPTPADAGVRTPFLLDFYPLEDARSTRLSAFFDALKSGKFRTTRCSKDGLVWPPRVVCPTCHSEELQWVDLPPQGKIYAFSAVLVGAPSGMEADVPYVVGLIDLEGSGLRIFARIVGAAWTDCRIGQSVEVETYQIPDGRSFFRFRVLRS